MPESSLIYDPVIDLIVGYMFLALCICAGLLAYHLFGQTIAARWTRYKNRRALRRERTLRYAAALRRAQMLVNGGTVQVPRNR